MEPLPEPKLLREVLRELRDNKGWSRDELFAQTREIGHTVPSSTIARYESYAGQVPPLSHLTALAQVLDVPVERFYEHPIAQAKADEKAAAKAKAAAKLRAKAQRPRKRPEGNR